MLISKIKDGFLSLVELSYVTASVCVRDRDSEREEDRERERDRVVEAIAAALAV